MKSATLLKCMGCLLCILFTTMQAFSQQRVSGKVVDLVTGLPLSGVTVKEKNKTSGTVTDTTGNFSIPVSSKSATLVFSYIGYVMQEMPVANQSTIDVRLQQGTENLSDVVVVGYGTAKKATLTGSISSIKGSEVVKSPAANVSNNLVGRLPGLSAVQTSGEPGYDGSTLRIRGVNTLNDNSVLVIVDGVPGRSLERIDPNSIESVTILKDASAAIYGSRAANGVILITTKRGRTGKPQLGLNLNYGYNQPTILPKMADAATYATMLNEIEYYKHYNNPQDYTPVYSPDDIQKYKDGTDPWGHPNTDWFNKTLKPWSAQDAANVTVSGGTENMRYFVSAGAKYQDGNYYHSATNFKQYDFRSNIDAKLSKSISLSFDVSGRQENRNFPVRSSGDIFRMVMRGKPNLPAYWPDGTPGPDIEYGNNPVVVSTDATGFDRDNWYVFNNNTRLNIDIPWIKGLSITGVAAFDKSLEYRKLWQTPWYLYTWDYTSYDPNGKPILTKGKRGFDAPQLTQNSQDQLISTLDFLVNYQRTFGDHNLKILAAAEEIKGNGESFNAFRKNFPSAALPQLFAGGTADLNNNGTGYVNSRVSYFGRLNYSFQEKYLAEFIWRYDGSYIFASDKRFGFFPGISAGWRVSKEKFWKANSIINDLKIRGSWGKTGNDRIPEWQYLATYGYGNYFTSPYFSAFNFPYYPYVTYTNGSLVENQTLFETRVPNPNVTWEIANQKDVGFDMSLLNNKLTVVADYFNYKRSNILWNRNASIPQSAGFALPRENIGIVANRGFDFNVSYHDHINKLNYSVSVNGGYAKNKVLFWDEAPGRPAYQQTTGHSMPSNPTNPDANLYYQAIGIFQDQQQIDKTPHWSGAIPGDIIFADVNGDGVIDGQDRVRNFKSNIPTFTGGVSVELQYANFDLSVLFQGATGAVNYISTESGEIGNFLQSFADGRSTPDHVTDKPRVFNRSNEYWVNNANTYWLHKTDYVRLKNLQLGYTLPSTVSGRIGMQNLRVFVSGYNLLTYSPDYKDFDPEASAGSGQSYPLQRIVSAGLSVTF